MKKQMFNFQIPTTMLKDVKKRAKADGVSAAHYIRVVIKEYLSNGK